MGGGSSDDRRRPRAALFLLACGVAGVLPHTLGPLGRLLPALGLAGLLGAYAVRTVFFRPPGGATFTTEASAGGVAAFSGTVQPETPGVSSADQPRADGGGMSAALPAALPAVDAVVAARDEEAVIARLVERVLRLQWPAEQLRLWVIDDGSEDRTPSAWPSSRPSIPS